MKIISGWISLFADWRQKNLSDRQFIYLLSFIIGLLSSLAAVLLKNAVHFTHEFIHEHLYADRFNLFYLAFPLIGIVVTVLIIKYLIKDDISHGITQILYSFSKKNCKLKAHNTYSSLLTSTVTVGFGGSVGLEAPIVLTGSAIGSNLGRLFNLNYRTLSILIGCGAAGAIGGIFKAPVAAVIFSIEVLMLDLTMRSLIPLLIASATGTTISYLLFGKGVVFAMVTNDPFLLMNIPNYLILGIFTGILSLYFTQTAIFTETTISRFKPFLHRAMVGGILLGLLIFLFPPLYGEGYETLNALLSGNPLDLANGSLFYGLRDHFWLFSLFLLLVIAFKVVAMALTTGSGGVGGIFAPTLFIGGVSGYFLSRLLNLLPFNQISERNFALAGMAGMLAGVMHAPLTAIFLIAEITGGYQLFVPLIFTATLAYITIRYFQPHSIYAKRLAARGELITHHKDKAVLTLLDMKKVIETDFHSLRPADTLGDLVKVISRSNRNIFPVLNPEGMLVGIVLLDNIRHFIFNTDMYSATYVRDLMAPPPAFVSPSDRMEEVMRRFDENNAWNLPVIDNGKYIGFLSKSKIFSLYRKWLIDISEE